MRLGVAVALFAVAVAGVTAADAADLRIARSPRVGAVSTDYFEHAQRSAMLWFWDDEPGVIIRAYWCAPWRHHHYFPMTGMRPKLGRRENLSVRSKPKPAQTFRRSWSNAWAFAHEWSALPVDALPEPIPQPRPWK